MRLRRSIILCVVLASMSAPGICLGQQVTRRVSSSSTLLGSCVSLEAQGKAVAAPCEGRLTEFDWTDGRVSFVFATTDGTMTLAFVGDSAKRTLQDGGVAVQPIEAMFNSIGTKTGPEAAQGSCDISAVHGGAVTVTCEAVTPSGRFAGRFISDGKAASTRIAGQ